ncbi:hypothetical protein RhiirC2_799123 [Rhizophagus irregularis]|uniref:Uncharacterized protein n=1 Tax=Rhizophagus irregularis TaxID=588596 RepID=A0A2N1M5J0_9GLOM|nr:hypothetical protein RhiirC2_799123 [Rhizophagus irregularis]
MSKTPCSVLNSKIHRKKVYLSDDNESLISTALSLVWTKMDKKIDLCTFEQDRYATFFVSVDKCQKNIISQKIVRIDSNTNTFKEVYDAITKDLFSTRNVHVYVGKIDNKWIYIEEGLYDELSLMNQNI